LLHLLVSEPFRAMQLLSLLATTFVAFAVAEKEVTNPLPAVIDLLKDLSAKSQQTVKPKLRPTKQRMQWKAWSSPFVFRQAMGPRKP